MTIDYLGAGASVPLLRYCGQGYSYHIKVPSIFVKVEFYLEHRLLLIVRVVDTGSNNPFGKSR